MKLENEQMVINNTQFWAILACSLWPTIIGYGGSQMAREAGRDMWLGGIFALINAIVLALVLVYIGRKFPGQTLVEYSRALLGNILSKILGLLLISYFLLGAHQSIAIYILHITKYLLPETPFWIIAAMHVSIVCYLVWHGPEVITRLSVIGFINAVAFTIILFIAVSLDMDFDRILPLFDQGLPPVINATNTAASFIGPNVIMVAMLLPLIKSDRRAAYSTAIGFILGGVLFIYYFIAELMVMGPLTTGQMQIACMELVRSIQITKYLHRFESGMALLWYWSILVQAGILTHCAKLAFQQTFGLEKANKILVPFAGGFLLILTYVLSYNHMVFLNYLKGPWEYISLPVEYGLPPVLLLLTSIKKPQKR